MKVNNYNYHRKGSAAWTARGILIGQSSDQRVLAGNYGRMSKKAADKKFQIQNNLAPVAD